MTPVPPQAITAAAEALRDAAVINNAGYLPGDEELAATVALEAAAPHLAAAAEADRKVIEGIIEFQVSEAVAAERERCAQLAERHNARYRKPVYTLAATVPPTMDLDVTWASFAALLREAQP